MIQKTTDAPRQREANTEESAPERARVLVVDDEEPIRRILEQMLVKLRHTVHSAATGTAALGILQEHDDIELMLLDVKMPGLSGTEVVTEALEIDGDLAIVMLSGMNDAATASICMQRGAIDYLTKPIGVDDLSRAMTQALRKRHTRIQNRGIASWLRDEVAQRSKEIIEEQAQLRQLTVATLEALVNALEAKDPYLAGHSARVAALSATIASQMQLDDDEIECIRTAGRLHDLGKIGTRESVLNKRGPLTPEEYEHVKQHVIIGSQILAPLTHLGNVIDYVRGHHERWDGSGYPDGRAGKEISLGARIIGAAEIYDALTTARSYQAPLSPSDATDRIRSLAGTTTGPDVADALAATVARRQTLIFLEED